MTILELLEHISHSVVKDNTLYKCHSDEYMDVVYISGRLYNYDNEELHELRTHEIIWYIQNNLLFSEV